MAEAVICGDGKKCSETVIKGTWTSIYDQAFNIELDNGVRLVTNLRYNLKKDVSGDPYNEAQTKGIGNFVKIESGDYQYFDSQCDKTMVGFALNIPDKSGAAFSMA